MKTKLNLVKSKKTVFGVVIFAGLALTLASYRLFVDSQPSQKLAQQSTPAPTLSKLLERELPNDKNKPEKLDIPVKVTVNENEKAASAVSLELQTGLSEWHRIARKPIMSPEDQDIYRRSLQSPGLRRKVIAAIVDSVSEKAALGPLSNEAEEINFRAVAFLLAQIEIQSPEASARTDVHQLIETLNALASTKPMNAKIVDETRAELMYGWLASAADPVSARDSLLKMSPAIESTQVIVENIDDVLNRNRLASQAEQI